MAPMTTPDDLSRRSRLSTSIATGTMRVTERPAPAYLVSRRSNETRTLYALKLVITGVLASDTR